MTSHRVRDSPETAHNVPGCYGQMPIIAIDNKDTYGPWLAVTDTYPMPM